MDTYLGMLTHMHTYMQYQCSCENWVHLKIHLDKELTANCFIETRKKTPGADRVCDG